MTFSSPAFRAVMSRNLKRAARTVSAVVACCIASLSSAQSASSSSFSLESSLLTGAGRAVSGSFAAESCIAPGLGGISSSTNFALTTGCGAALTLSGTERAALGLLDLEPVAVPATSDLIQILLSMLIALMGWLALRRKHTLDAGRGAHSVPR